MQPYLKKITAFAEKIIGGETPDPAILTAIAETKDQDVFHLIAGADLIRNAFFKKEIHLCTICNGKSGQCSENCGFCAQSKFHTSEIDVYPLLSKEKLMEIPLNLYDTPVNRYSVVTSGKGLKSDEVKRLSLAFSSLDKSKLSYCASLGILEENDFKILKKAGVTRYHHNLETAESHFKNICTTHSFENRVNTIKKAKKAGLEICSGGIFGIGETDDQVLELALELKRLDVDAVPLNFLSPVPGTRMENCSGVSPLRCLKIIALFRFVLPDKDIFVCGGRQLNLKKLEPYMFHAGASGIMTGNYLTTKGTRLSEDLEMIRQLDFKPRHYSHVYPQTS